MPILRDSPDSIGYLLKQLKEDPNSVSKENKKRMEQLQKSMAEMAKPYAEQAEKLRESVLLALKPVPFNHLADLARKVTEAHQPILENLKSVVSANSFARMEINPGLMLRSSERVHVDNAEEIADRTAEKLHRRIYPAALPSPQQPEQPSAAPLHHYNPATGHGSIKNKRVRLRQGKSPFQLFALLVAQSKLSRSEVINLLGYESETSQGIFNKSAHSSNTYKINEVVKSLRYATGLTTEELINNAGNIILTLAITNTESPRDP